MNYNKIIIIVNLCLIFIGLCINFLDNKYSIDDDYILINKRTNIDFSTCDLEKSEKDIGIGDHDINLVLNCKNDYKSIEKEMQNWKKCPMDELLYYEMYIHKTTLSKKYNIPNIDNCFYKFISLDSKDYETDFPMGYVIALYDRDNHYLYYIDRNL